MTRPGNERIDTVKNSDGRVVCCGVRVAPLVRCDVFCRAALYQVLRPLSKIGNSQRHNIIIIVHVPVFTVLAFSSCIRNQVILKIDVLMLRLNMASSNYYSLHHLFPFQAKLVLFHYLLVHTPRQDWDPILKEQS